MLKLLEDLKAIQEHDRRITRLKREQTEMPERKAGVEARLQDRREALAHAEEERKRAAAAIHQLEMEIEGVREKIARFRKQQFEIKSNDEYRALVREIELHEQKIRDMEDRELELMEQNDIVEATVKRSRSELETEEKEVREDLAALDERAGRLAGEIEQLERERVQRIEGVDATWLSRYERILNHTGDFAVVPVENGNCGGCHMKLPPQAVHDARRGESVTSCTFCGRLLYCDE